MNVYHVTFAVQSGSTSRPCSYDVKILGEDVEDAIARTKKYWEAHKEHAFKVLEVKGLLTDVRVVER